MNAGRKAFLDAIAKAKPLILEPIVSIEAMVPADNMGDIAGDLSSRRGRVVSTDMVSGGRMVITGQAPLAEMTNYQSRLKSVTGGEGSYNMEFANYEPAPAAIQKQLMSSFEHPVED